ncbi:hypothetical protein B6A10_09845 [Flavobacterium sp. L1I52]|uniref:DUF4430 domain-containing protein n=1 Tax=Flavobacterium pokkalii TaxID=1940408 RepID=A0ABR7UU44_9FLAO|nr:hypothetical protein [Flavobacterium pokkalii]MBD0725480.1 hypothetical protein [Flavobacterium pokkalii]
MRKIFLLFIFFVAANTFAQTNGINYQAIILNPKGEQLPGVNNSSSPLVNKNICMVFKFIDEFSNVEYQETVQTKTDAFGMVNLVIGSGNQTAGYASSFKDIVWGTSKKSLIVGINTEGSCSNYVEISNQDFNYVPLAFSAINAENVTGVVGIENGGTNATTLLGARTNLGIENVDNTSDLNKPISAVTQIALNLKEDVANKSTNVTTDGTSDTKYPSVKSVKTYVDATAANVSAALATEVTRATAAENTIAANLVTETNNRSASDNTLTTNLTAETVARTAADVTLTTDLATEVANRITADSLKEDVANKSTNVTTDGTSDTKYPSVKSVKTYVDTATASSTTSLTNEINRATAAENIIAANLVTETNNRSASDNTLTTNLTAETAARTAADGILTTDLATEVANRITADLLKEDVANKSTNVITDGTSDTKYPSVKSVKTYVDATAANVSTALATEVTRATAAENTIAANLVTETNNRSASDNTLTTNLTAETAARTAADVTLQTNIAAVQADVDANEAAVTNALNFKAPLASPALTGTPTAPTATVGTNSTQIATTAFVTNAISSVVIEVTDEIIATAAQTSFILSQIPSSKTMVKMFVNGIRISNSAYSWSGTTLTYNPLNNGGYVLSVDDRIQFDYFFN